jgi:lysosomal Pro-X carboxypeptidase
MVCLRRRQGAASSPLVIASLCLAAAVAAGSPQARRERSAAAARRVFLAPRAPGARAEAVPRTAAAAARLGCRESWFEQQRLDHFSWTNDSVWAQRYFICDANWQRPAAGSPPGPIFFYCGNEGGVEGYVAHTGLMHENAAAFGALLVFAEHRYYGQSLPMGNRTFEDMSFLTHEQALADYATLIQALKAELGAGTADVIAFGGSYGGMLAAWFRMKYPHIVLGSIAASAPILAFPGADGGEEYGAGGEAYWAVVTRDASPEAQIL